MAVEEEPTHPPVDKLTTVLYALSGYCSIDWLYNVILSVTIRMFFFSCFHPDRQYQYRLYDESLAVKVWEIPKQK